jgi:hypothetical protein
MRKRSAKRTKAKSAHDNYDLPDELDFNKLKFVGFGIDALERHAASKKMRTVSLDPDVAQKFHSTEEVNEALRLVQKLREIGKPVKRKKSA